MIGILSALFSPVFALVRSLVLIPFMVESNGTIVLEDYDGEKSTTNINLQNLDNAGTLHTSIAQDLDEVKDGILAVVNGEVRSANLGYKFPESSAAVTDTAAAREGKWLVTMRDTTQFLDGLSAIDNPGYNKLFTFEIGCADRSLLAANSDELDITAGAGATLKAALDPNVRSPWNRAAEAGVTPSQEVIRVKYVGRNI